ncbi:MAG: hypothetical protein ACOC11_01135, partial [Prolixibacteraceae bacterium]
SLVKFRTGFDARKAFPVVYPVNNQDDLKKQDFYTATGLLKMALDKKDASVKPVRKKKKKKKENRITPWFHNVVQGVLDYMDDDEGTELK